LFKINPLLKAISITSDEEKQERLILYPGKVFKQIIQTKLYESDIL